MTPYIGEEPVQPNQPAQQPLPPPGPAPIPPQTPLQTPGYGYARPKALTGWTSCFGILMIIFGALYCLTIIGAIVGVPFILAGLKLTRAVELSKDANQYGEALRNVDTYFKIMVIMMIVMIGIGILVGIIAAIAAVAAIGSGSFNNL